MSPLVVPATQFRPVQAIATHGDRSRTKRIVLHVVEGSADSAYSWFHQKAAGGVGSHLLLSTFGAAWQLCQLQRYVWHAGGANADAIGIEHAGYASWSKARWLGQGGVMLAKSANRTAWLCYHYNLGQPTHHVNVFGHSDGGQRWGGHTDPGKGWPWDRYIAHARRSYATLKRTHGKHW